MASEGTMADEKHAGSPADHRDPDNDCRDTPLVLVEPDRNIDEPVAGSTFHPFSRMPWELRRLVWEFALPRNVFRSARLDPKTCVPCPTISLVCREASLVVKELGSMATAWDRRKLVDAISSRTESITTESDIYLRTWFSPKLDTMTLDVKDSRMAELVGENVSCDLIDICKSPTTCLMIRNDPLKSPLRFFKHIYQNYLQAREVVLLSIESFVLVLKGKAWNTVMALQMMGTVKNATQVIRLGDTAALAKYLKVWEQCCQYETPRARYCDFGAWLAKAITDGKRGEPDRYMRAYTAWVMEDREYKDHLVSPMAYLLLRLADHIMSGYGSQPNPRRGHEIVDFTGKLKKNHPLVRELNVKLPEIIPAFTVTIRRQCRCSHHQARTDLIWAPKSEIPAYLRT